MIRGRIQTMQHKRAARWRGQCLWCIRSHGRRFRCRNAAGVTGLVICD